MPKLFLLLGLMKLAKNDLISVINFIKSELKNILPQNEINASINILLMHYLKLTKVDISLNKEKILATDQLNLISNAVNDIKNNKPLAYILGEWEFCGLRILLNEKTLIPRQETEELVQLVIDENTKGMDFTILDIGTGSGCIALALKANLLQSTIFAWDINKSVIDVAKKNAKELNLSIKFEKKDILKEPKTTYKFDVIVSNPPYIPLKEKELMYENVLNYEPHLALFVEDEEPLLFYNAIANFALSYLNNNGKLYFEINEKYGKEVKQLLINKNFKNVNIVKDMNEKDRIVSAEKVN